jgi:uncharacterized membrane protein (UPF0127 family)
VTAASFLDPIRGGTSGLVLRNRRTGTVVASTIEAALDSESRRKGLLGRDSLPEDHALVIAPSNAIHMFFMRFPIDVLFVKRNGEVARAVANVRPWRIAIALGGYAAIEMPVGAIERSGTRKGDILEFV